MWTVCISDHCVLRVTDVCELGQEISGDGQCRPCPRGSYQESRNHPVCLPCPYGWTTPTAGAMSLQDCSVGQWTIALRFYGDYMQWNHWKTVLRWGFCRYTVNKDHATEDLELSKPPSLKPGVDQNIALHASPAARIIFSHLVHSALFVHNPLQM